MPNQPPHAAWITQLASGAFIGAGGILLLLATTQPGTKGTSATALQFVSAAAMVALTHWSLSRRFTGGMARTTFRSPLHAWGVIACATAAIGLALSAIVGYVWEIAHESLPLDRAKLLALASPVIGVGLCASILSWALSARPARSLSQMAESPPQS